MKIVVTWKFARLLEPSRKAHICAMNVNGNISKQGFPFWIGVAELLTRLLKSKSKSFYQTKKKHFDLKATVFHTMSSSLQPIPTGQPTDQKR